MNAMPPPSDVAGASVAARDGRVCILMNRASGKRGTNGDAEAVRRFARDRDGTVELRELDAGDGLEETCRAAVEDGFGTVVAAGGDGTIGAVAACLADSGRKMGVLPLGTFNFFARSLGIPQEVTEALEVLEHGRTVPVTAAEANGRLFLNNASIGIYPHILRQREETYRRWGRSRLVAYWSVIRTVAGFRGSRLLRVIVDGKERRVHSPLVFVAISAYQIDEFRLEGAERVRDGEMAVFVAPDCGRLGLLRFALLLLLRGMRRGKDFELFHGREVEIRPVARPNRKRLIARDGEKEWMAPPFRFRVRPDALNVIVPAREGRPEA